MYYVLASWTKLFFVYFLFSPKSKIIQPCSMCVKMKIAVQVTAGHESVPFLGSLGNAFSAKLYIPSRYLPSALTYLLVATMYCICSKLLNHGSNHGLFLSLFKVFWIKINSILN